LEFDCLLNTTSSSGSTNCSDVELASQVTEVTDVTEDNKSESISPEFSWMPIPTQNLPSPDAIMSSWEQQFVPDMFRQTQGIKRCY